MKSTQGYEIISGFVIKLGDNIDTDVIIPGRYLTLTDPKEIASHALEAILPDFPKKAKSGVIIVAGRNFGCGSSREQAPIALKYSGVKCIIAKSFARIFYRNCINIGLPILKSEEAYEQISENDYIEVNVKEGIIFDKTKGREIKAEPLPEFLFEIVEAGGLVEYLKTKRLKSFSEASKG